MTNKEAINLLDNLKGMIDDNQGNDYDQAFRMAIKALEKAEKYRWHDLGKNPDDLPEKDGNDESDYVLVIVGNPSWNHWEQAYYHHGKKQWSTYDNNVIAWKHVEPFEEKDDVR